MDNRRQVLLRHKEAQAIGFHGLFLHKRPLIIYVLERKSPSQRRAFCVFNGVTEFDLQSKALSKP